jgi:hypothetical protein
MNEKYQIKIETNNNWSLLEFETFIHSLNSIYFTLYVCTDLIDIIKDKRINETLYLLLPSIYRGMGLAKCIKNRNYLIKNEDSLNIKRIRMESPGDIVIEGGGIIRELRELIKDKTYRNEQEKELGQLNILEKKLEILGKYGIPKNELSKVLKYADENEIVFINFHHKGLLGNIIDTQI